MGCNTSQEMKTKEANGEEEGANDAVAAAAADTTNSAATPSAPLENGEAQTNGSAKNGVGDSDASNDNEDDDDATYNKKNHSKSNSIITNGDANLKHAVKDVAVAAVASPPSPTSPPTTAVAAPASVSVEASPTPSPTSPKQNGVVAVLNGEHNGDADAGTDVDTDSDIHTKGSANVEAIIEAYKEETRKCDKAEISELNDVELGDDEEKAATKIQAFYRGLQVRATMKKSETKATPTAVEKTNNNKTVTAAAAASTATPEQTKAELEAEFDPNDKELCDAALKIQATFRGHLSRKMVNKEVPEDEDIQEITKKVAEELDIDLTDPELHKAATKIQASFRGHKTRKDATTD